MRPLTRTTFFTGVFLGTFLVGFTARAAEPTTADCLDASEKSLTLRSQHKLREARDQLLICSAASCPTEIRDECVRRVGELNASVPTMVFRAEDAAGNDLTWVQVTMDGVQIADRLAGVAISLDPGEHAFTFETLGQTPVQKKIVLLEGEKNRQLTVKFGAETAKAVQAMPVPAPNPITGNLPQVAPAPSVTSGVMSTRRILAIVSAGVGVVGAGLGIAYGIESMAKHDEAKKVCPSTCTDQHGVDLWNQASTAGNISTVGFIVGAAGLVGATALWLTGKPATNATTESSAVQVSFGLGSIQFTGAW